MIGLVDVCQNLPGCELMSGHPLQGVIVQPPEATCIAYRLPSGAPSPCIELGDIVPLGRLYDFGPGPPPGEAVALLFQEPA